MDDKYIYMMNDMIFNGIEFSSKLIKKKPKINGVYKIECKLTKKKSYAIFKGTREIKGEKSLIFKHIALEFYNFVTPKNNIKFFRDVDFNRYENIVFRELSANYNNFIKKIKNTYELNRKFIEEKTNKVENDIIIDFDTNYSEYNFYSDYTNIETFISNVIFFENQV